MQTVLVRYPDNYPGARGRYAIAFFPAEVVADLKTHDGIAAETAARHEPATSPGDPPDLGAVYWLMLDCGLNAAVQYGANIAKSFRDGGLLQTSYLQTIHAGVPVEAAA